MFRNIEFIDAVLRHGKLVTHPILAVMITTLHAKLKLLRGSKHNFAAGFN